MKLNVVNQKKIVVELVKGYSFRQISKNLHVSPSTVSILATKLKEVSIPVNELLLLTNEEFIDVLQTRTSKNIDNCKPLPEFDYIATLYGQYNKFGTLPFSGSLSDQPNKIIEYFNIIRAIQNEEEQKAYKKQEQINKRKK